MMIDGTVCLVQALQVAWGTFTGVAGVDPSTVEAELEVLGGKDK